MKITNTNTDKFERDKNGEAISISRDQIMNRRTVVTRSTVAV